MNHTAYRYPPAPPWYCCRRASFPRLIKSLGTCAGATSLSPVAAGNQVLALACGDCSLAEPDPSYVRCLQTGHTLSGKVAEQQAKAEQQHQPCRAEFDAAHDERAAALASGAEALGEALGGDGDHRNGRDRDRGADAHHEGCGDAGPEQPLRECEH